MTRTCLHDVTVNTLSRTLLVRNSSLDALRCCGTTYDRAEMRRLALKAHPMIQKTPRRQRPIHEGNRLDVGVDELKPKKSIEAFHDK